MRNLMKCSGVMEKQGMENAKYVERFLLMDFNTDGMLITETKRNKNDRNKEN